jgi:CheY-like chemotaxis protein
MQQIRLDGVSVLFVDDRRDARFVVEHILRDAGAQVTALENGLQAIEAVESSTASRQASYDVVVMDVHMPVMDGLMATKRLRTGGYQAPILALTAGAMEQDRQECLEAGCNDYMAKPIDGERLVQRVRKLAMG